jgi:2-C-methyl-D-erythritol 2,4-cyclodiphosphate synthase
MDLRFGIGYDIHAFGADRPLVLGGVEIPCDRGGLAGHSDADVLLHAVTDAVLGALALGDLGDHFPPDDSRYRDARSTDLLATALELAAAGGYRPRQVDTTVVAEEPRLAPHRDSMRAEMARALGLVPERVSVKATTAEGLGALGEGRGIAAWAVVVLERLKGEA